MFIEQQTQNSRYHFCGYSADYSVYRILFITTRETRKHRNIGVATNSWSYWGHFSSLFCLSLRGVALNSNMEICRALRKPTINANKSIFGVEVRRLPPNPGSYAKWRKHENSIWIY